MNLNCRKNDFIVWLKITEVQHKLYKEFLSSEEAHAALNKTNSPLAALSVMKKICDHPQLLHREMKTVQNVDFKSLTEAKTMEELISQSGKLVFLFSLLKNIKANGHRILI